MLTFVPFCTNFLARIYRRARSNTDGQGLSVTRNPLSENSRLSVTWGSIFEVSVTGSFISDNRYSSVNLTYQPSRDFPHSFPLSQIFSSSLLPPIHSTAHCHRRHPTATIRTSRSFHSSFLVPFSSFSLPHHHPTATDRSNSHHHFFRPSLIVVHHFYRVSPTFLFLPLPFHFWFFLIFICMCFIFLVFLSEPTTTATASWFLHHAPPLFCLSLAPDTLLLSSSYFW